MLGLFTGSKGIRPSREMRVPYLSRETEAAEWIARCRAVPDLRSFAISTAEDGLVGVCRLRTIRNTGLFSIWIGSDHQARGLGTEALRQLLEGAASVGTNAVSGAALTRNIRSHRMMERCGMQRVLPDRLLEGERLRVYMHPDAHRGDIDTFLRDQQD